MIFVTVGTQLPFERLIKAIDLWAKNKPDVEVVMQTGETVYEPSYCKFIAFTDPQEWDALFNRADLIISHAGMGTILKSLDYAKPLIIMPRLAAYGEHRNDHQLATAERFKHFSSIKVVENEVALTSIIENPPLAGALDGAENENLNNLISALKNFIQTHS